jgi:hypothetical protein
MRTAASRLGLPAPDDAPALPMPAHHGFGRDQRQVLASAGAKPASQDPKELVPEAQASTRSGSGWPGQDGELMTQQQVLDHEVVAWAQRGQDGREQQPEQFKHALRIADSARATFCRPTPRPTTGPIRRRPVLNGLHHVYERSA